MIGNGPDDWIQTFSGRQFWPLDPKPEHVSIVDVAHALSMKCRFTGHTRDFYSVAQHSVLCSRHCPTDPRWALMHDAAEAYLPDVARPVKRHLAGFREIEDHLLRVIAERFGLPWPMHEAVGEIDLILLGTERRDLMATPPIPWRATDGIIPLPSRVRPLHPAGAKEEFLVRFSELFKDVR